MQRRLASLALDPKVAVDLLSLILFELAFNVDVALLVLARRAHNILDTLRHDFLAAHALGADDSEATKARGGTYLGLRNSARMLTSKQRKLCLLLVTEDRLENTNQRQFDLVFDVITEVDGQVVLQHVDRVLRLFVSLRALCATNDNISDTIADVRRRGGVSRLHLLGETNMSQVARVRGILFTLRFFIFLLLSAASFVSFITINVADLLGQTFSDDKERQINAILQQVTDDALAKLKSAILVEVVQQLLQSSLHGVADETASVTTDRLNTLGVHLVWLFWIGPVHAGVPLLIHKQVWVVDLLELKLDWIDELLTDKFGRLLTETHGLFAVSGAKLNHD